LWYTFLKIKEEWEDRLSKILIAVKKKDVTFLYDFVIDDEGVTAVRIKSNSLSQSHTRGVFLKKVIRQLVQSELVLNAKGEEVVIPKTSIAEKIKLNYVVLKCKQ